MRRIIAPMVALIAGLAVLTGVAISYALPISTQLITTAFEQAGNNDVEWPSTSGAATEFDEDFGEVEVYDVLPDASLDPAVRGVAAEVWDQFVRMVGPDVAAESIIQFRVGDDRDSDTLAYVYQDRKLQYWALAVNVAYADDEQLLLATLIHEWAHVFSFDYQDFDRKTDDCTTIDLFEGCAASDSYLYEFYDTFWTRYTDAVDLENLDPDAAWEFYLAYEEDFVSDYAATNLGEDFAESFMTYVIEDSFDGPTVAAQKLRFFEQYPELVALREHIRDEFAVELGLR